MIMHLNKEDGFTLLETLIALMMTSAILLLLTGGLLQITTLNRQLIEDSQFQKDSADVVTGDRQIEWHLFLNQLEGYLQGTIHPEAVNRVLRVEEYDEGTGKWITVEYRQPFTGSTRNIYQFKNTGNIRLLTGVESPAFQQDGGWLRLDFKFRNGERYTGRIWVESWLEENEEN